MESLCRIELLGGLLIQQGERMISRFSTHKAAALLAYLAYYLEHAHPREALIEMLWPECLPESGRNSLRVALTSLRHQLEPPGVPQGAILQADNFAVRLNPALVATDVALFQAALHSVETCVDSAERTGRYRPSCEQL